MKLLDLRKVHLGGDQNTWDVVFHVVLLSKKKAKSDNFSLERRESTLLSRRSKGNSDNLTIIHNKFKETKLK